MNKFLGSKSEQSNSLKIVKKISSKSHEKENSSMKIFENENNIIYISDFLCH